MSEAVQNTPAPSKAETKPPKLLLDHYLKMLRLPSFKRQTNDWEQAFAQQAELPEARPLNLDPGYLTEAKLVLASTKDHAHRIYLGEGIYAEVTLNYRKRAWQKCPWTYPDYQRQDFQAFFTQCRQAIRG